MPHRTAKYFYWMILPVLAGLTILPSIFPDVWILDNFAHFRLQYLIILLILLSVSFIFRRKLPALLVILFLISWNGYYILPLFVNQPDVKEAPSTQLSLLSINLLSSNTSYEKVRQLIRRRDPDVIILLELNTRWEMELRELFPAYHFGHTIIREDNFGIALLSKRPVKTTTRSFGNNAPPSIIGVLQVNNKPLTILATHPVPPVNRAKFDSRNRQLNLIAEEREKYTENFILAGDLNTSSYSENFRKLKKKAQLADSRKGRGVATSWPTGFYPLRITLDHFLIGGNLQVMARGTEDDIGSDHLPVYLEVGI